MKIERPRHLQKLLERSLETGDAGPLEAALAQTPAADVQTFLSSVDAQKRKDIEKLLAKETVLRGDRLAVPGVEDDSAGVATPGRRIHAVRARKHQPWWQAVKADPLPSPIHPEPARDIEIRGERFSKDDVASMLRLINR